MALISPPINFFIFPKCLNHSHNLAILLINLRIWYPTSFISYVSAGQNFVEGK